MSTQLPERSIPIECAYCLGLFEWGKKRPIFVKFAYFSDVQEILRNAYLLQRQDYSNNKNLLKAIALARKELWPTYKNLCRTSQNCKVILAFPAKIIKDGEIIIDRFPDWDQVLNPPAMKSADRSKPADCSTQSHQTMNELRSDTQHDYVRRINSTTQSEPMDHKVTHPQYRDSHLPTTLLNDSPVQRGHLTRTKYVSPCRSSTCGLASSKPASRTSTPGPSQYHIHGTLMSTTTIIKLNQNFHKLMVINKTFRGILFQDQEKVN